VDNATTTPASSPTFTPTFTSTPSETPTPTITLTLTITPTPTVAYSQAFLDPQSEADFDKVMPALILAVYLQGTA
jgi:hypothetical protein